jgi:hypothetical protein
MKKMEEPKNGFRGAEIKLENRACAAIIPVCGTEKGWAKA